MAPGTRSHVQLIECVLPAKPLTGKSPIGALTASRLSCKNPHLAQDLDKRTVILRLNASPVPDATVPAIR